MSAHTAGFDAPFEGRPAGMVGRFRDFFNPAAESSFVREEPEREFSCRYAPPDPMRMLGDGDAFEFNVYPTLEWRGMATDREELQQWTVPLRGQAARQVGHVLRPIARTFEPHRSRDFEIAANKRTYQEWWTIRNEGRSYALGFSVRCEPDERIQEHMRPYWEARIKAECDHQLGLQRARQVDELTRHWSTILDKLEQDPRTIHAAMLSEKDFADVFGTFVEGRQKVVRDLLDLLRTAVDRHGDVGLGPSEFTRAWDQALKAFQRQHGLDVADAEG
jgi:hypothetical protein